MAESVILSLELEAAGDSLTGRARDASGTTKEFSGWLGLAAAIDALLPAHGPEQTHPTSHAGELDDRDLSSGL